MFQGIIQALSNPALAWPLVITATLLEVIWFVSLKKADGLAVWPWNLAPYVIVFIGIPLLSIALKSLPTGSVYAFWTGVSAVVVVVIGILFFSEPSSFWRLFFIALAIVGIVGIYLTS